MLFDGLTLVEQSKAVNLTVDSGMAFPTNPNVGELFFLSTDSTLYSHNGTDWVKFLTIKDMVYDIVLSYPSDVAPDETILVFSIPRTMKLLTTPSLYTGRSLSPSSTTSIFSLRKNNVEIGTIQFQSGVDVPTFNITSETTLAVGDYLTIVAPAATPHGKITISMKAVLT